MNTPELSPETRAQLVVLGQASRRINQLISTANDDLRRVGLDEAKTVILTLVYDRGLVGDNITSAEWDAIRDEAAAANRKRGWR